MTSPIPITRKKGRTVSPALFGSVKFELRNGNYSAAGTLCAVWLKSANLNRSTANLGRHHIAYVNGATAARTTTFSWRSIRSRLNCLVLGFSACNEHESETRHR
jgi:hypothetical protein